MKTLFWQRWKVGGHSENPMAGGKVTGPTENPVAEKLEVLLNILQLLESDYAGADRM